MFNSIFYSPENVRCYKNRQTFLEEWRKVHSIYTNKSVTTEQMAYPSHFFIDSIYWEGDIPFSFLKINPKYLGSVNPTI